MKSIGHSCSNQDFGKFIKFKKFWDILRDILRYIKNFLIIAMDNLNFIEEPTRIILFSLESSKGSFNNFDSVKKDRLLFENMFVLT